MGQNNPLIRPEDSLSHDGLNMCLICAKVILGSKKENRGNVNLIQLMN